MATKKGSKKDKSVYKLTITPAIDPRQRHAIENKLEELGYHVYGGGTDADLSQCDISFER